MERFPFIAILLMLLNSHSQASTNAANPSPAAIIQTNTDAVISRTDPPARPVRYAPVAAPARKGPVEHIEWQQERLRAQIKAIRERQAEADKLDELHSRAARTRAQDSVIRENMGRRYAEADRQVGDLNKHIAALEIQRQQYLKLYGPKKPTSATKPNTTTPTKQQPGNN